MASSATKASSRVSTPSISTSAPHWWSSDTICATTRRACGSTRRAQHQAAVELDDLGLQPPHAVEVRMPGAEVVERDQAAGGARRAQPRGRSRRRGHGVLQHFEHQSGGPAVRCAPAARPGTRRGPGSAAATNTCGCMLKNSQCAGGAISAKFSAWIRRAARSPRSRSANEPSPRSAMGGPTAAPRRVLGAQQGLVAHGAGRAPGCRSAGSGCASAGRRPAPPSARRRASVRRDALEAGSCMDVARVHQSLAIRSGAAAAAPTGAAPLPTGGAPRDSSAQGWFGFISRPIERRRRRSITPPPTRCTRATPAGEARCACGG